MEENDVTIRLKIAIERLVELPLGGWTWKSDRCPICCNKK